MNTIVTIPGQADVNATKEYADQVWQHNPAISPDSWRIVEGLTIGKCAFSGPIESTKHLKELFVAGTNLYMVNSETTEAFGKALQENIKNGVIDRRCIVVVVQIGLIYGKALQRWKDKKLTEITRAHEDLWHCMDPEFLTEELAYIQKKAGLESFDCVVLQDPEYTLAATPNKEDFHQKLQSVFTFFENMVKENSALFYGLCSNTLTTSPEDKTFIDLARIHELTLAAAQQTWGRRKRAAFRALTMPFNLLETSAIHNTNTTAKIFEGTEPVSTLELAARMKLSVFATRPLHAFIPGQGVLPLRPTKDQPELITKAQSALRDILEENLTPSWKGANLPAIALNAAASTPGISCVVDHFKSDFINDNKSVYERGNFPDPLKFIENV